jgi:hypothetical protein
VKREKRRYRRKKQGQYTHQAEPSAQWAMPSYPQSEETTLRSTRVEPNNSH